MTDKPDNEKGGVNMTQDRSNTTRGRCFKVAITVFPAIVWVLYLCGGAWMFSSIEGPQLVLQRQIEREYFTNIVIEAWERGRRCNISGENDLKLNGTNVTDCQIDDLAAIIALEIHQDKGLEWSFLGGIHFCLTVVSTIGGIHAEEDIGFYYEYEIITAMVPEVNIAIDRVTLTDPADQRINITDNGITISAKIRIGSFVETGYVIGDRNWRLTFFAANSTNHKLSAEFPATLSDKQQAMDLDTSSTLTFNNVKGNLFFGSLNCSTFARICVKLYESDEGFWVKGEKSLDIACTDISCNYGNRGASSGVTSYFILCMCLQTAWMYII